MSGAEGKGLQRRVRRLWYIGGFGSWCFQEGDEDFEQLAAAVHGAWMDEKRRQGVTDHPDLKPYATLSEHVKEYDRATVRAILGELQRITEDF